MKDCPWAETDERLAEKIRRALPYATVTVICGKVLVEVPKEKMEEAFCIVKNL